MSRAFPNKIWDTEDPNFSTVKYEAGIGDVLTELYLTGHAHVGVNADGTADNETIRAKTEGLRGLLVRMNGERQDPLTDDTRISVESV